MTHIPARRADPPHRHGPGCYVTENGQRRLTCRRPNTEVAEPAPPRRADATPVDGS